MLGDGLGMGLQYPKDTKVARLISIFPDNSSHLKELGMFVFSKWACLCFQKKKELAEGRERDMKLSVLLEQIEEHDMKLSVLLEQIEYPPPYCFPWGWAW